MPPLLCLACNREVDLLLEICVIENGMKMTIRRCQDCMQIAQENLRRFMNADNN